MHDKDDAPGGAGVELVGDCADGVVDPGADGRVAGLVHGEVEGAGGEEGCRRVEAAVVEQRVDGNGEERGEGGQEGRCGEQGEGEGGAWRGRGRGSGMGWMGLVLVLAVCWRRD